MPGEMGSLFSLLDGAASWLQVEDDAQSQLRKYAQLAEEEKRLVRTLDECHNEQATAFKQLDGVLGRA